MPARTAVDRSFFAVCLGLVGVVAVLQATLVTRLLTPHLTVAPPSPLPGPNTKVTDSLHARSADGVVAHSPLDSTVRDLRPHADTQTLASPDGRSFLNPYLAAPCPGAHAVATAAADDPASSFVLLAGGDGEPAAARVVRQGDRYGGRDVWFIAFDRAFLSDGASLCQAEMFAPPAPVASASASATPTPPVVGIRKLPSGAVEVDRTTFERIRSAPQEMLKGVRALPESVDGRPAGVRLFGLGPTSPLVALGLENGDRLSKINGLELGTPESLLQAYAALSMADHFSVEVLRQGKVQTLDVALK